MAMQIEPASPTGRRKITTRMIAVQAGRPSTWEPVRRGLVWGAFKRAVPALGVPRRVVELVDYLVGCTMDVDWMEGDGRLLVWPSNDVLMDALDIGLSQIKTLLRLAQEHGLIEMCDSANGKRYGWRANGRVVEAYGFDLAPFAARHAEFQAIAAAHEERRREGRHLRGRIGALRRHILSLIDTGAEQSAEAADWSALARQACELAELRGDSRDPTYLGIIVGRLTALFEEVQAALATLEPVETDPKGSEIRPHYTPTNHRLIAKANTVVVGPSEPWLPKKKRTKHHVFCRTTAKPVRYVGLWSQQISCSRLPLPFGVGSAVLIPAGVNLRKLLTTCVRSWIFRFTPGDRHVSFWAGWRQSRCWRRSQLSIWPERYVLLEDY